jgi:hypothetical protein
MSLARAVHSLVVDLDQLNCLYHQLKNVPNEVQQLFRDLDSLYGRLLDISGNLLRPKASELPDYYVQEIVKYRRQLVDVELFIDPNQMVPRSGVGQNADHAFEWAGQEDVAVKEYCSRSSETIAVFDAVCKSLLLDLNP